MDGCILCGKQKKLMQSGKMAIIHRRRDRYITTVEETYTLKGYVEYPVCRKHAIREYLWAALTRIIYVFGGLLLILTAYVKIQAQLDVIASYFFGVAGVLSIIYNIWQICKISLSKCAIKAIQGKAYKAQNEWRVAFKEEYPDCFLVGYSSWMDSPLEWKKEYNASELNKAILGNKWFA